jgi:hypothetical protein
MCLFIVVPFKFEQDVGEDELGEEFVVRSSQGSLVSSKNSVSVLSHRGTSFSDGSTSKRSKMSGMLAFTF